MDSPSAAVLPDHASPAALPRRWEACYWRPRRRAAGPSSLPWGAGCCLSHGLKIKFNLTLHDGTRMILLLIATQSRLCDSPAHM